MSLDEYQVGVDGPWGDSEAGHLYRRTGFGGTPEERAAAVGAGDQQSMRNAVDALVNFQAKDPWLDFSQGITNPNFGDPIPDLPDEPANDDDLLGTVLSRIKNPTSDAAMQGHWLYRMRHSTQPLQEQLTLFFHDHMVSEFDKVANRIPNVVNYGNDGSMPLLQLCTTGSLPPDENRSRKMAVDMALNQNYLFRESGADSFRDLLVNITRDPMMLIYLDNALNVKDAPQENYAREVMELFSMGVGNYTEFDIREIAKSLTGETLIHWLRGFDEACANDFSTESGFLPEIHEPGDKFVFSQTVKEDFSGQETLDVIDLILNRISVSPNADSFGPPYQDLPATAVYMSWKLLRWFVNHDIQLHPTPDPIVLELADYMRGTDNGSYPQRRYPYDIRASLRKLFLSKTFYAPENFQSMHKTPVEYIITALRGLNSDDVYPILEGPPIFLLILGMRPFNPPNVAGWNHGQSWTSSGSLIARNFYAFRYVYEVLSSETDYGKAILDSYLVANGGSINGFDDHDGMVEFVNDRLMHNTMTAEETQTISDALTDIAAMIPQQFAEAGYYLKIQAAIFIAMTMPRFQLK